MATHPRPFSPCGRRWQHEVLTDEGGTSELVAVNPSSDPAAQGHLLPQGEKEARR